MIWTHNAASANKLTYKNNVNNNHLVAAIDSRSNIALEHRLASSLRMCLVLSMLLLWVLFFSGQRLHIVRAQIAILM